MKNKKEKFTPATGFTAEETQQIIDDSFALPSPSFTKGPWSVSSTNQPAMPGGKYYMIWNQGRGRRMLAKLPYDDEVKANAHLIASAPELYSSLVETLSCIDQHTDDPVIGPIIESAIKALARARGES